MRVERAQRACLGLHPGGRGVPAAVEGGQDVHGVVPGVEEDPAPEVRDAVRAARLDTDQAAALADAGQVLFADAVPCPSGERGEDSEGEQGFQGAGGRESAVGVVGGQYLAGTGVRDQP
jgi:hypothetical protein